MSSEQTDNSHLRQIWLFGRPFCVDDIDSLNLTTDSGFERAELDFVAHHVKPGSICVDIGANIGLFTVTLARATGRRGRVYAFEPDPYNFALLERNVAPWRDECDIQTFRLACSDEEGSAALHASTENRGMHRMYESVCCAGGSVQVEMIRADKKIPDRVDFVKVDVEGYEPFAVRGLAIAIARSPQVTILTEFSPLSMLEAGSSASAYLNLLLEFGLRPFRIVESGLEGIDVSDLRARCANLEHGDFRGLLARCAGLGAQQVFDLASHYATQLAYGRTLVENLVFRRDPQTRA